MAKFANVQTTIPDGTTTSGTDGAITASDKTFTSSAASFVEGDVGLWIDVEGAGPGGSTLTTTIASRNSGTSVELTDAASTTVSGATYRYNVMRIATSDWTDDVEAYLLFATSATALNTVTADAILSEGCYADGDESIAGSYSEDGPTNSNTAQGGYDDCVLRIYDTTTVQTVLKHSSVGAGEITLEIDTNDDNEYIVVACLLSDMGGVAMFDVDTSTTVGGQVTVDTLSFEPDFLLAWKHGPATYNYWSGQYNGEGGVGGFCHSIVTNESGGIKHACHAKFSRHNRGNADLHERFYTDKIAVSIRETNGTQHCAAFVDSFETDGFVVETSYVHSSDETMRIRGLAIKLTSDDSQDFALITDFESHDTEEEDEYSGLSFEPGFMYRLLTADEDGFDNGELSSPQGVAIATAEDQYVIEVDEDDNAPNMVAKSYVNSGMTAFARVSASTHFAADFVEFGSAGPVEDWTTVNATTKALPSLFVETWATSEATGTGTLSSGSAATSGSGVSSSTGTGAPAMAAATASGAGVSASTGTGVLGVTDATVAGTGAVATAGTGVLAAQSATASGEGVSLSTGTGALTSESTVSGAGVSLSTGTGVLAAQSAAVSGTGVSASTGTGVLAPADADASGEGVSLSTGTGALTSDSAVSGEGISLSTGAGTLAAADAAIEGTGGAVATGTGVLVAQAATASGEGVSLSTGAGTLAVSDATSTGAGTSLSTGTGTLTAQAATIAGEGAVGTVTTGTGVLVASAAAVAGAGVSASTGTGTLVGDSAVAGSGVSLSTGTGSLAASAATVVGAGANVATGTGVLVASGATVSGTGVSISTATGALQVGGAAVLGAGVSLSTGTGVLAADDATIVTLPDIIGTGALSAAAAAIYGRGGLLLTPAMTLDRDTVLGVNRHTQGAQNRKGIQTADRYTAGAVDHNVSTTIDR